MLDLSKQKKIFFLVFVFVSLQLMYYNSDLLQDQKLRAVAKAQDFCFFFFFSFSPHLSMIVLSLCSFVTWSAEEEVSVGFYLLLVRTIWEESHYGLFRLFSVILLFCFLFVPFFASFFSETMYRNFFYRKLLRLLKIVSSGT